MTKTCIPHDIENYVTELNIGSTHSVVSRIDGSRDEQQHVEWWGVLLNWDVLPRLRKITINGTVAASRVNSGLAKSPCHTLNDPEALEQLAWFAESTPAGRQPPEMHIYGVDETVVMAMSNYPALQKCIRTLWFHDQLDDTGSSIKRTLPDFGRALAGMTQLRDLSISVGAPAVANFTHFLQVLGKFPYLKKLHLSYGTRPVMDDSPLALGVHNFRPIVPPSLEVLDCPYSFLELLNLLEPFTDRTFQEIHDLTLHVDRRRVTLDLPFYSLEAFQVYMQNCDNVRSYTVEGLLDMVAHNARTLKRLAVAKMDFTDVMDLPHVNPNLEELHIGILITGNLPVWTPVLDYLQDLKKLKHLTLNVNSIRQLSTRMFGTLLTRSPISEDSYEPSTQLQTVTIKFNRTESISKLPSIVASVNGTKSYNLTSHASFHKARYMMDEVPGVDNHRVPEYLWEDGSICAAHVVFDARAISMDLYPDYYSGKYKTRNPYSNTSSVANSDDEMY